MPSLLQIYSVADFEQLPLLKNIKNSLNIKSPKECLY